METLIFTIRYESNQCVVKALAVEGRGLDLNAAIQNWVDARFYLSQFEDDEDESA